MSKNTGTLVIASVRPYDSTDTYPVGYADEMKGGLHIVADDTARNNIPSDRLEDGMLVCVLNSAEAGGIRATYQRNGVSWTNFTSSGAQGATGGSGPQGANGSPGGTGPQGANGSPGGTGPQGADGAPGSPGSPGGTGPQGTTGPQGASGAVGGTLAGLTDVSLSSLSQGQALTYNAGSSNWNNTNNPITPNSSTGYVINVMAALTATLTDGGQYYFGCLAGLAASTTNQRARVYADRTGRIKSVHLIAAFGTFGSSETWGAILRINNGTAYNISNVNYSDSTPGVAVREWWNTSLNIPISAGDYFEMRLSNPTWVTNPANMAIGGTVYIDTAGINLTLSTYSLSFHADGTPYGASSITVTSDRAWSTPDGGGWLGSDIFSGAGGSQTMHLTIGVNSGVARSSIFHYYIGSDIYQTCTISQDTGIVDSIYVDYAHVVFDYDESYIIGNGSLVVTASGSWYSTFVYNAHFYASPSSAGGSTTISIGCNGYNYGSTYNDTLNFYCGTASTSCAFVQNGP